MELLVENLAHRIIELRSGELHAPGRQDPDRVGKGEHIVPMGVLGDYRDEPDQPHLPFLVVFPDQAVDAIEVRWAEYLPAFPVAPLAAGLAHLRAPPGLLE